MLNTTGPKQLVSVAVAIGCGSIVVSPITLVILEWSAKDSHKSIGASLSSAFPRGAGCGWCGPVPHRADRLGSGTKDWVDVTIQTLVSNVAHPLLVAGLAWLFAVSPLAAREAIVLTALPAGFFGILFGLRFGLSSGAAGTILIASTALSAVTLSAAIYLTSGMGPS